MTKIQIPNLLFWKEDKRIEKDIFINIGIIEIG